jgi:hypothetical protein
MDFRRPELAASVGALIASPEARLQCLGHNFHVEENVCDRRRDDFERYGVGEPDLRAVCDAYFRGSVQGLIRGHQSSTFDETLNEPALLPATIEPNQKIVRLEWIDGLIAKEPTLTFTRLAEALIGGNDADKKAFVDLFGEFPGERPAFAAFRSEVEADMPRRNQVDGAWVQPLIDRLGLYHYYAPDVPQVLPVTYSFALMQYSVKDVLAQVAGVLPRPFALATVLECRNNPAFFPVPQGSPHGFTVDLRDRIPAVPAVREILHARFDYQPSHLFALGQWTWTGKDCPDILARRHMHLDRLRRQTGRATFGAWPEREHDGGP